MNFRIMLAVFASLTIAACSGSKPADDAAKSAEATSEGAALASEAAPAAAAASGGRRGTHQGIYGWQLGH